jgi:hypothetical protein
MSVGGDSKSETLFGELWTTGEVCVMFGEAGVGKSLLGVQIADSITNGKPIAPFDLSASPQKVLYVDLEKTAEQFKRRYSGPTDGGNSHEDHYRFSKHFLRAVPAEGDISVRQLERMITKSGA